ncbi:MAG: CPBP family intramembrane metalloprotease [Clostridia bacterium]|nr:CPBP family intramembrane metalloprotease [Clostridia bacterium]
MKRFAKTSLNLAAETAKYRRFWLLDVLIAILLLLIAELASMGLFLPFNLVQYFVQKPLISSEWSILLRSSLSFGCLLFICVLYCILIDKRSLAGIGFVRKNIIKEYGLGFLIGGTMISASVFLCILSGTAQIMEFSFRFSWSILLYLLMFLVQGMAEEVLCRGFLMLSIANRYRPIVAITINSALFMLLHIMNSGLTPLAFLNLFLFGCFASVYLWKRGNIWGIGALHSAWNFFQGNMFGILVSGNAFGPSVLSTELSESAVWFNGGAFGLEGGLAVTITLVISLSILLLIPVRKSILVNS